MCDYRGLGILPAWCVPPEAQTKRSNQTVTVEQAQTHKLLLYTILFCTFRNSSSKHHFSEVFWSHTVFLSCRPPVPLCLVYSIFIGLMCVMCVHMVSVRWLCLSFLTTAADRLSRMWGSGGVRQREIFN